MITYVQLASYYHSYIHNIRETEKSQTLQPDEVELEPKRIDRAIETLGLTSKLLVITK